jgi:molecular chaperone HscC
MGRIVGIDLGTTNSLCAVFEDGSPRLLPNALGEVLTPSVVGVLEDGSVVVGKVAQELGVGAPERVAASFKRWMGTDRELVLAGRGFSPQELSSLVLRALKRDAETALGEEVSEAVITVPAYFNEHQRAATRMAGELAGFRVRRILNEPTAAALAYGLLEGGGNRSLLVFDLGGGTFDVTVMEVFEGTFEIRATAGESQLGGEDFTALVVAWVLEQAGLHYERVEVAEPLRLARLRLLAESAKRRLGIEPEIEIALPRVDGTLDESCPRHRLLASELPRRAERLLERLRLPLARALRDARLAASGIDEVLLAGGATRMPWVQELVREHFGREPRCTLDPDLVVARGAAIQAALIASDAAVEDLVLTDVCPFTLGVEVLKQFGSVQRAGYYLPVIHRNTTIPVAKEEFVSTVEPNQRQVTVRVFQGESRRVEENLLLGTLEVRGIPPGPSGQSIAIRFSYDINGLLEVEARIERTGQKFSALFTQNVKNLSKDELARAAAKLQRLKFFPREDERNQHLLRFAERVVGQVGTFQRTALDEAIDAYETALHDTDRAHFEAARSHLLQVLAHFDHPFPGTMRDS